MSIYGRFNEYRYNHIIATYDWLDCNAERINNQYKDVISKKW